MTAPLVAQADAKAIVPIAVLASGRGSNFDAISRAIDAGWLGAKVVAVVSDQPDAPVLDKARALGIPTSVVPAISSKEEPDRVTRRKKHDARVLEALAPANPRFLVMAGYMRVVTPVLIEAFRSERGYSRITNIHPSLLPAFPGVESYAQAYRYGTCLSGATVHLVEETVDSGPICAQESFSILGCQSEKEVEKLGLAIEHRLYPQTLAWVLAENFEVEYRHSPPALRRLCVRPN